MLAAASMVSVVKWVVPAIVATECGVWGHGGRVQGGTRCFVSATTLLVVLVLLVLWLRMTHVEYIRPLCQICGCSEILRCVSFFVPADMLS